MFRGPLGEAFRQDLTRHDGIAACDLFETRTIDGVIDQHRSDMHDHSRVLWLLWMFHRFLTDVHSRSSADTAPVLFG